MIFRKQFRCPACQKLEPLPKIEFGVYEHTCGSCYETLKLKYAVWYVFLDIIILSCAFFGAFLLLDHYFATYWWGYKILAAVIILCPILKITESVLQKISPGIDITVKLATQKQVEWRQHELIIWDEKPLLLSPPKSDAEPQPK